MAVGVLEVTLVPASQPVGGPKNTPADIAVPRVPTPSLIVVEEPDKEVEENDCDPFVLTEGWIETKIYQYLIHPVQPYHDSFGCSPGPSHKER